MKRVLLLDQLRQTTSESAKPPAWDVVETRLRLPRKLIEELKKVSAAERLSMNALVAGFIDAALVERGRRSVTELAP